MKKKILIVAGDPESINSEILFKCWKKIPKQIKKKIIVIGNFNLLEKQKKILGYKVKLFKIKNTKFHDNKNSIKIIDLNLKFNNPFKIEKKSLKKYIINSLNLAHKLALDKKNISGIINCPIKKNLLGDKNYGVTEYLASKCSIKNNSEVMLIRNNKLSVSPITTHCKLRNVASKINKNLIISKVKSINLNYKKIFTKKPNIALLGLNPHNSEMKKNSEEMKVIFPAIKYLKNNNVKIYGPYVSDTMFINNYKKFDIVVGMYHDQVLTPFKALYKYNAINLTLGLKYLRVSPDHGVASDIIGKNLANTSSINDCINFLNKYGK